MTITTHSTPFHVANPAMVWVHWVIVGRAAEWLAGPVDVCRKTRRKVIQKIKEGV